MDLQEHVRGQLKKSLVMRHITCNITGDVLDVRTCVTVNDADGDPAYVFSPAGWDQLSGDPAVTAELTRVGFTVSDPRA